ncbi:hypothetical protein Tco_1228872 [Tanacetum coccineum]
MAAAVLGEEIERANATAVYENICSKHRHLYSYSFLCILKQEQYTEATRSPLLKPHQVDETNDLSKPVTSNSVPTPQESKIVKHDNVIAPGIFRINPFKATRVDNFVPNKHVKTSVRTKPIIVSQPHVITKNDVNSKTNGFSPKDSRSTTRTRRPKPWNNSKSDKVPFKSNSGCLSNKLEKIEENHRSLQSSHYPNHTSSECNNIKLAIRNEKSEKHRLRSETKECKVQGKIASPKPSVNLKIFLRYNAVLPSPSEPIRKRFPSHLSHDFSKEENQVVSKSSAVTTADASDKCQQQQDSTSSTSTLATTITADGNFDLNLLGSIIGSGLFEVDVRFVSGAFSGVLVVKVEAVIGGSSLALGLGKGASMGIEEFLKRMLDAESRITCDNTNGNTALSEAHGVSLRITYGVRRNRMEQGIAHKLVIVEVFHDLRGDFRVVYHNLCLGGYIDTRPNGDALRKCILEGPYKLTTVTIPALPVIDDTPAVPE